MRAALSLLILSALISQASVVAAGSASRSTYYDAVAEEPDVAIEACQLSILARGGFDSPSCVRTLWFILLEQHRLKQTAIDSTDKDNFQRIVNELVAERNPHIVKAALPQAHDVRSNIDYVVSKARDALNDDNVSYCLAEIRYRQLSNSSYCDYALALLNLALFTAADTPRLKLDRADMAAALALGLP